MKKKYNVSLLKNDIEGTTFSSLDDTSPFTKINEKPLNVWTKIPNEIVEAGEGGINQNVSEVFWLKNDLLRSKFFFLLLHG